MLSQEIKKMVEEELGMELRYPADCLVLSQAIFDKIHKVIGETTLQRAFGFFEKERDRKQRDSTMDILAEYLGYPNYKLMAKDMNEDTDISDFQWTETVEAENLKEGTQLQITYDPNRLLVFTYLGANKFIVNESIRSKLQMGDILEIHQLKVGHELLVNRVIRDNKDMDSYTGAKQGGLTSIEIFN